MKGQVEQIMTRQDNVVKLTVTIQPENCPDNIIKWRFQDVEMRLSDEDMVTISKTEYEALTSGKSWIMPEQVFQSVKTAITVLKDLIDSAETKS